MSQVFSVYLDSNSKLLLLLSTWLSLEATRSELIIEASNVYNKTAGGFLAPNGTSATTHNCNCQVFSQPLDTVYLDTVSQVNCTNSKSCY